MQRAEIGILPLAARSSADALPDSVSMSAGFGVKVMRKLYTILIVSAHCLELRLSALYIPSYFIRHFRFCQVLPLTTHSLQVGFGSAITAHRLVPLPDRSTGGTVQQGCGAI